MKILLTTLLTSISISSFGKVEFQKSLALAPEVSEIDALKFLKDHPGYILLEQKRPIEFSQPQGDRFLNIAQMEFLEGSIERAKTLFLKIVNQRFTKNWDLLEKRRISYSFFRLAQLSSSKSEKTHWLKEAFLFHPGYSPNDQSFPPPIIQIYNELKANLKPKVFELPKDMDRISKIYVNGKNSTFVDGLIRLVPGRFRFTFISPYQKEESWVGSTHNLKTLVLKNKLHGIGGCRDSQKTMDPKIDGILYKNNCLKTRESPSHPLFLPKKVTAIENKTNHRNFWKKNRIWMIAGSIVLSGFTTWRLLDKGSSDQVRQKTETPPSSSQNIKFYGGKLSEPK